MIEVLVAVALLSVAMLAALMSALRTSELQASIRDYQHAHNAARSVVERLRNGDLVDRFEELAAGPEFADGDLSVAVSFPEDVLIDSLGGPPPDTARFRDMDEDGAVDLDAGSADEASLLPVQVSVSRPGFEFRIVTLVSER